jgi:hypothetical protein
MPARPGPNVAGSKVQERDGPCVVLVGVLEQGGDAAVRADGDVLPTDRVAPNRGEAGVPEQGRSVVARRHQPAAVWGERHREYGERRADLRESRPVPARRGDPSARRLERDRVAGHEELPQAGTVLSGEELAAAGVERDRVDGGLRPNAIAHGSGRDVDRNDTSGGGHDSEDLPIRAERRAFGSRPHVGRADGHMPHRIEELDRRPGVADRERAPVRRDRDPLRLVPGARRATGGVDPAGDRRGAFQRREQCAPRFRRSVDMHGLPRHQQRQLRIGFETRTGGQASGVRERQRLGRSVPLGERQFADHQRCREQHRDAGEEPPQPAVRPARPGGLALRRGAARPDELPFEVVQIRIMGVRPTPAPR